MCGWVSLLECWQLLWEGGRGQKLWKFGNVLTGWLPISLKESKWFGQNEQSLNWASNFLSKGFTNEITCAGNDFDASATSCQGDSGSPVIRRVSGTSRGNPYYQQEYIVGTGLDCNLKATIYTRVSNRKILNWIQEQTDTNPLVMVIGGYTKVEEKRGRIVPRAYPGPTRRLNDILTLDFSTLSVNPGPF